MIVFFELQTNLQVIMHYTNQKNQKTLTKYVYCLTLVIKE